MSTTGTYAVSMSTGDRSQASAGSTGNLLSVSSIAGSRSSVTLALRPAAGSGITTTVTRYGYLGAGDSSTVILDGVSQVVETTVRLVGGAFMVNGADWRYPDLLGSIAVAADSAGFRVGASFTYDPDGNSIGGDTSVVQAGDLDTGWLGGHGPTGRNSMSRIPRRYDYPTPAVAIGSAALAVVLLLGWAWLTDATVADVSLNGVMWVIIAASTLFSVVKSALRGIRSAGSSRIGDVEGDGEANSESGP